MQRFTEGVLVILTVLAIGGIIAVLLVPVHNGPCRNYSCGAPATMPDSPGLTP